MPLTVGLDLGTTSVTAVALDAAFGAEVALAARRNPPPEPAGEGRFEWPAEALEAVAVGVLRDLSERLGPRVREVAGLGLTGQQHGVVVADAALRPLTPFINWQDRRCEEVGPDGRRSYLDSAVRVLGPDAARRAGCLLSAGFLGATLYWMAEHRLLPPGGLACSLCDWIGARLTGARPVTDPTNAAGSGLLDLATRTWNHDATAALGLPSPLFPRIAEAGERLGQFTAEAAAATGLPAGLPVGVGLGDNQAGFLGAVAERDGTALVNVGTGAQVSCYCPEPLDAAPLETRPFPRGGYLLCHISLSGGRSYALLHRLFEDVGRELFGVAEPGSLYAGMHRLAAAVAPGAGGLKCQPCFAGARWQPGRRGLFAGIGEDNLTPGHLVRALLEGLAAELGEGLAQIRLALTHDCSRIVGAGNGLRQNPVLARSLQAELGLPLAFPAHREEAAYGAALVAAVGAGLQPDLAAAGRLLRHEPAVVEG